MKIIRTDYAFNASARTITFTDAVSLSRLTIITNVVDNVIIYNFADPLKGGSVTGLVLTLDYDTTSMADADTLQVWYEDSATGGLATEVTQLEILTDTSSIEASSLATSVSTDNMDNTLSTIQTEQQKVSDSAIVLGQDAYSEGGSRGLAIGAVRNDADTALADTDLEFAPIQVNDEGRVKTVTTIKEVVPTSPLNNNGSLVISNDDPVEASTKTITKTINSVSYEKTLSLNAGGDVIAVSAWVEI